MPTSTEKLLANAQSIIEAGQKLEPAEWEVFASSGESLKIVYEATDFSLGGSHASDNYGVRTIAPGGRMGFTTTNADDPSSLASAAQTAQGMSRLAVESPYQAILAKPGRSEDALVDTALEKITPRELFERAEFLVAEARKDSRVLIDRVELSADAKTWACVNSHGVARSARQSNLSWSIMGMAKEGTEVASFDYDGSSIVSLSEFEKEARESMARFRASVLGSLNPKPGRSYRGVVILSPEAVADLVLGFVSYHANARNHQDDISRFKDKLGEQVFHPSLTVFEDPLDRARVGGWSPFDREGCPTSRHDLVKEGRLSFLGHTCFTAKRGNTEPTGNSAGGSRSLPSIGFSNLTVDVASELRRPMKTLLKDFEGALYLKRFSGNEDPVSGTFSGVAKNSRMIQNGELGSAVANVMISGDFYEMLRKIVAASTEDYLRLASVRMPALAVDGISVTAG